MSKITYKKIDHLAIAVDNLENAVDFYCNVLGMEFVEKRITAGRKTGMVSAVLNGGGFNIVLMQGNQPDSQISRYIEKYGQGVQHAAFEVDSVESTSETLSKYGVEFATDVINGDGLKQIFTKRDSVSGMMIELIERTGAEGFQEDSVKNLFNQLESSDCF